MRVNYRDKIDAFLHGQKFSQGATDASPVYLYAESIAVMEKSLVVVSDIRKSKSSIFCGAFAGSLGIPESHYENSIWEKTILDRVPEEEREGKYLSEILFYNYLRHIPRSKRENFILATSLIFNGADGRPVDVLHRMQYLYEEGSDSIRYGICRYDPLTIALPVKSMVVDLLSGQWEELKLITDSAIISCREKQVLTLIEKGLTSKEIADKLCISKNTVSRHRQQILARLQCRNSTEACRRAKQLKLL